MFRGGTCAVDADVLMEFLDEGLVELFHTEAQDGSSALVAAHVIRIAAQLRAGNSDEALQVSFAHMVGLFCSYSRSLLLTH
jgi:hypothetical protein